VSITAAITQPANASMPHALISVVDTGIGMSAELLPRVFELFTQGEAGSSQAGLGIGLALARRLVELHGGRLDARSDGDRRGSAFVIQLPASTTQAVSATEKPADERRLHRRILVIDDNQDAADTTALLIEHMGGDGSTNPTSSCSTSGCEG
jgi:hypothetical protein